VIWKIGKVDRGYSELAIPGQWDRFRAGFGGGEGVEFEVGSDDAADSWPYVHPGPADAWAGSRGHAFCIRFDLDDEPGKGIYELRIALVAGQGRIPPRIGVSVNSRTRELEVAAGSGDDALTHAGSGRPQELCVVFGAPLLRSGRNEIVIETLSGSWMIYDAVVLASVEKRPPITGVRIKPTPVYVRSHESPSCVFELFIEGAPLFDGGRVELKAGDEGCVRVIPPDPMGISLLKLHLPLNKPMETATASVTLFTEDRQIKAQKMFVAPRRWVLYFLHHTHLDIGFTHTQEEVEARQMRFIDQALELAEKTKEYPPGTRFKWLPEGLWPVESYMKAASPEKREAFIQAVKAGTIGLDALYGNALTGLYSEEELFALTDYAKSLEAEYGVTINTAMISDVPGYTWGIVPALAHAGVRYLSIGPNSGHRIGSTRSAHGDIPFYWVSPSGKEKILCWMAGKGYSWFHTGSVDPEVIESRRPPERFFSYLEELEESGYPYDMVQIRYNIGADNGPPDPTLCDFVKEWNEKYAYPRIVIATSREMFETFEKKYGDKLPKLTGDFTPYWEDGASSTAADTGICRTTAERLVQAEVLFAMLDPEAYAQDAFWQAWRGCVLYDEHTWGAWNSISDPDNPFVKTQAEWKSECATNASGRASLLIEQALGKYTGPAAENSHDNYIYVFNTCSWARTGLAGILRPEATPQLEECRVLGPDGIPVPSQRLGKRLCFLAEDVPPFGAKRFTLVKGRPMETGSARAEGNRLWNERISLEVDPETGAIKSLKRKGAGTELVDRSRHKGLNDYIYVTGRDCDDKRYVEGPVEIKVLEKGPLVAALLISSNAPGCDSMSREIWIRHASDRIEINNRLLKEKVRTPEGVHLAFPWSVPDGQIRIDTPWAVVRPELDQMRGANKDYFTVQRWVDVSNRDCGVTWVTEHAPMIEVGKITMDVYGTRKRWRQRVEPTQTFYSYVMNNYWETNYAADQEGLIRFRYFIEPHGVYDPAEAQRIAIDCCRPLVATSSGEKLPVPGSFFRVEPNDVIVTSLKSSRDGKALMVRLFNASGSTKKAHIGWERLKPKEVWISSPGEERSAKALFPIEMPGMGIVTLRID